MRKINLMEEAYTLLYQWINNDNYDKLREKYRELYRSDLESFNNKFNLVTEMYKYVINNIKTDRERIEYYFKERNPQYCTLAALSLLMDNDIPQYKTPLYEEKTSTMSLADRVFLYAAIINGEEAVNTPKEELSDEAGLISFMEASELDADTKWEIVKIFNRQEFYYNEAAGILNEVIDLLNAKYEKELRELSEGFYNYWESAQDNMDILETLRGRLKITWTGSEAGHMLIPSVFSPFGITIAMNDFERNKKDLIRLGIMLDKRFELIFDKRMSKEDIVELGKVLSDKSKVDILELVSKKPYYGKELANALGLSTATISYHVNALLKEGCLQAEVISNKVYYSIDNEKMSAYLDGIKSFFTGKKA